MTDIPHHEFLEMGYHIKVINGKTGKPIIVYDGSNFVASRRKPSVHGLTASVLSAHKVNAIIRYYISSPSVIHGKKKETIWHRIAWNKWAL